LITASLEEFYYYIMQSHYNELMVFYSFYLSKNLPVLSEKGQEETLLNFDFADFPAEKAPSSEEDPERKSESGLMEVAGFREKVSLE